jgi:hypothetical protein
MKVRESYIITLEPKPSNVPPIIRLRRALKVLGRSFDLRAVDVKEIPTLCEENKKRFFLTDP